MLKRFFYYYGFFLPHRPMVPTAESTEVTANLQPTSTTLDHHLEFIKDSFEKEDERRETLETKAGQLLGQAGLILSLVGIITPFIADSLSQLSHPLLYIITSLFIATILFFTNSIYHASTLNKALNWPYMRPSLANIFSQFDNAAYPDSVEPSNFYKSELIIDYYKSSCHNAFLNNQKADYLNYAAHSFSTALLLSSVLILSVCFGLTLKKDEPSKVIVVNGSSIQVTQRIPIKTSRLAPATQVEKTYQDSAKKIQSHKR